ncbi:MAG: methyltransferase [Alphaproteobacteria bacterium]|jgi:ribosomal protein L11 methyltransferase|nr:methyltransferase [Alphaproteobacteria bacterium]MBT5389424.1 methyltransferase [Alphaproteobacteria bacterium]MBT5540512.1 methyltransferase [Alphaproteobacteria bacterium]MBT5655059.1 methyltransferase [Alphaproteobacteria bacterium]
MSLLQLTFELLAENHNHIEQVLEPHIISISSFEIPETLNIWSLDAFFQEPSKGQILEILEAESISDFTVKVVPDVNWLQESYKSFPPLTIGDYFIYGSHYEGDLPNDKLAIILNAATAFGSGEHPTTAGCLQFLSNLKDEIKVERPLDMGCGSGILAIAIAKAWSSKVIACDIDPESVRMTEQNAVENDVENLIQTFESNGYDNPLLREEAPFDLIVSNILAKPLIEMASGLSASLAPNGLAILSGLLESQMKGVTAAHEAEGVMLVESIFKEGWATLLMKQT